MRLVDAASRSTNKTRSEKKEDVVSFFNRLVSIFYLHCPDCGGKIEDIGRDHGSTVYECTVCHKKWI